MTMPCTPCDNGKWKWGHRGDCEYDSKEECEKAHAGEHQEEEIDEKE